MKKKIAILGSTGSIGKNLINIIKKDKKNYEIVLLSADENYRELLNQARLFKVKNLIITNKSSFLKLKKSSYSKNLKIFNNFNSFKKIFKSKIDYTMSSITGIRGLQPTIEIIKYSKKIAIANKEAIICGWDLIEKNLKKYKTKFVPVDSEHFSIWYALKDTNIDQIEKIYITASGGPFLNKPIKKLKKVSIYQAIKHPNWKMGKKISIDSATLMNKIFEVIEAKNIFKIPYKKIRVLLHPKSYIHAILQFKNGITKIIAHDTTMEIPIFNSLHDNKKFYNDTNFPELNLKILNNLSFNHVDPVRYPVIKLLNILPKKNTLFETVIVSANDKLVELFLKKKISYTSIQKELLKLTNLQDLKKFKRVRPKTIKDILELNDYVRLKILKKVYKS
tara:strand:+ start:1325 stop:2500 length:1176 start_codon:yes stop_codon:yes gene_type:complete